MTVLRDEPQTTLEKKSYSPVEVDETMEKALRGRQGKLTKADAIAVSGLPSHMVDDSLERMLKRYRSRLEVTEDGELLYSFDPALVRRDELTLAERARVVGRWLATAGMWFFKAWIMVTLVAYVIAFVVLLLAVMFGGRSRDDDRGGFGGGGFGWMWWFLLPDPYHRHGYIQRDRWGRPLITEHPPARGRFGRPGGPKKKFLHTVYDFVFGPARPERDRLADEREILGYLREHDGRITATDLVMMFGWSYPRAEEEVTRLLIDYDGDPQVTDDGVIIYEFPKLLRSAEDNAIERWTPAWDKLEQRPALTSNSKTADWLVGGFAAFNLFMSFFAASWARMRFGLAGPTWDFLLTVFPLVFFTIFLSIPLARAGLRLAGDRGRKERNDRRLALKRVFAAEGGPLPADPALEALLLPLAGEPEAGEGGKMFVRFPRIAEEREALQRYLAGVDVGAEKRIGKVIFGGDDDEANPDDVPKLKP